MINVVSCGLLGVLLALLTGCTDSSGQAKTLTGPSVNITCTSQTTMNAPVDVEVNCPGPVTTPAPVIVPPVS